MKTRILVQNLRVVPKQSRDRSLDPTLHLMLSVEEYTTQLKHQSGGLPCVIFTSVVPEIKDMIREGLRLHACFVPGETNSVFQAQTEKDASTIHYKVGVYGK